MLTFLVVVALVVGAAGLIAGFLALVTLGRLRRGVGLLARGAAGGRESFLEASARHVEAADRTRADVDVLRTELASLATELASQGIELARLRTELASLGTELARLSTGFATPRADLGARQGEAVPPPGARSQLDAPRAEPTPAGAVRRSDLDQILQAERGERGRDLNQVQKRVESDFTAMRAELERMHLALSAQTQAERSRLAGDNSATRDQLRAAIEKVEQVVSTALRRIALVRYDAFDDLGGRLSFSLAVLDSRGDGVTLTSLAGREETRVYAKSISAGAGVTELSPEEREAVAAALAG